MLSVVVESAGHPIQQGRKELAFKTFPDQDLGDIDGRTEFINGKIFICVKRSVYTKARFGDGRSRMTLAHELGHGVMHLGAAPKHRRSDASGTTVLSRINASESAEHQAKVFASAFLIDDTMASEIGNAEDISAEFGVSLTAAEICLERLLTEAERSQSAQRVMRLSEEAKAALSGRPELPAPKYLQQVCSICGNETLLPIGSKAMCDTCNFICDQL